MTLLKNEKGLLPLGRDVRNIAVIGPHANSVVIGFAAYTYPAALQMLQGMLGGGETSMAGVGDSGGDSAWLPAEAKAALANELKDYVKVELADYVKRSYPVVSLAEAVRQLGQKWGSGYRRTKADIHKGYLDMPSTPLFPFGHGLSYTTFEYSPLMLASATVDVNGEASVSVTITNTGKRRGTEVVQLYAADTATGATLPAQQLIGFARAELEPGASKTVSFSLPLSVLAYTGISGGLVMEPGPVELSVGSSSSDIRSTATVTITGKTRVIKGEERAFLSTATVGA